MRAGGGTNHRGGLDDGILIKDNHIRLGGGVVQAVQHMKAAGQEMPIEIEAQSLDQVDEARRRRRRRHPARQPVDRATSAKPSAGSRGRAKVELSGGVTLDRIPELAATGADFVSVGALTHSAAAVDLSFELEPESARARREPRRSRMSEPPPPELTAALESTRRRRGAFGEPLYFLAETGSTNDVAAALAERGAPEGATVVACAQSAGRGRFGRQWFSPPGAGLYVSVVCRERGGGAAADARRRRGCRGRHSRGHRPAGPDQVAERRRRRSRNAARRRKLAGILAEASTGRGRSAARRYSGSASTCGPAAYPPELADRATSVETELGRAPESGRCWPRLSRR